MGCVERYGYFKPYETDRSFYDLRKIRTPKTCQVCDKKLLKGTYCLKGWGWWSAICLDCGERVLENGVEGINDFLKKILKSKEDFKAQVQELKEKNIVNEL